MKFILDGCDGVGKTTLANMIAEKYKCDVLHMTLWSDKSFVSHVDRMINDNIVFDRSFISEYVYAKVFNRETEITEERLKLLIDVARIKGYNIYVLTADEEEILRRLNVRNDETEEILSNIKAINDLYLEIAEKYNITVIGKGTTYEVI